MRYALNGNKNPKEKVSQADEIILDIPLGCGLGQFISRYNLDKIVEDFKDKTIIINGVTRFDIDDLPLAQKYPNILLSVVNIDELKHFNNFNKIFTLEEVNNYSDYGYLKDLGVKRMVIGGDLGFALGIINSNKDIVIMANPCYSTDGNINSFFIRPEDVEYYSKYIDTLFFPTSLREFASFKIYKNQKPWHGELKEIILGLNSSYNNKYFCQNLSNKDKKDIQLINKVFKDIRCTCERRCQDKDCNLCFLMERLSKVIEDYENKQLELQNKN